MDVNAMMILYANGVHVTHQSDTSAQFDRIEGTAAYKLNNITLDMPSDVLKGIMMETINKLKDSGHIPRVCEIRLVAVRTDSGRISLVTQHFIDRPAIPLVITSVEAMVTTPRMVFGHMEGPIERPNTIVFKVILGGVTGGKSRRKHKIKKSKRRR